MLEDLLDVENDLICRGAQEELQAGKPGLGTSVLNGLQEERPKQIELEVQGVHQNALLC